MAIPSQSRFARFRLRVVIVLAMAPLALWSGRPVCGCTCAKGCNCPCCQAALRTHDDESPDETCTARGCCCCCRQIGAQSAGDKCCRAKMACCERSRAGDTSGGGQSACRKTCCTCVAHLPAIPAELHEQRFEGRDQLLVNFASDFDSPCHVAVRRIAHRVDADTGLPPTDLVVALQRLVI